MQADALAHSTTVTTVLQGAASAAPCGGGRATTLTKATRAAQRPASSPPRADHAAPSPRRGAPSNACLGLRSGPPTIAIAGAGILGLSAARILTDLGFAVVIFHDRPLLETTSAKAAGLIEPVAASDAPLAQAIILGAFAKSFPIWRNFVETHPRLGAMRRVTGFRRNESDRATWADTVEDYRELSIEEIRERVACTEMRWAETFRTPVINTKAYIAWMAAQLCSANVTFVHRHLASPTELAGNSFDAVVNATGIGSAQFVGDTTMTRCDGHVITIPRPRDFDEVIFDWDYPTGDADLLDFRYAIARTDDVVLGGTLREGATIADGEPALEPGMPDRLLNAFRDLAPTLTGPVLSYEAGSRPMRAVPCLGVEHMADGTPLAHVYGTGGSGWTLAPGLAHSAVELLLEHVPLPTPHATAA